MSKVYLSLGSNLGNKEDNIRMAIEKIEEQIGAVVRQSALLCTEPWGFDSDNKFVNAAICVETDISPRELLRRTQRIERELGRTHKSVNRIYHDRLIDIDILLYGDETINEPDLIIPHPLMYDRDFVMIPLREIMAE